MFHRMKHYLLQLHEFCLIRTAHRREETTKRVALGFTRTCKVRQYQERVGIKRHALFRGPMAVLQGHPLSLFLKSIDKKSRPKV
jgi:hypothetical protein